MESNVQKIRESARHLLCVIEQMGFKPWCADDPLAIACDKLDAALALPQRNCDAFADNRLVDEFCHHMGYDPMDPHNGYADGQDKFMREHWFEFSKWIAMPYERKGESNGCEH